MEDVPVFEISKRYSALLDDCRKCRIVYEGGRKVRQYLIQGKNESDDGFIASVDQSAIGRNFTKGINNTLNLLFKNSITITEDVKNEIRGYYDTADGSRSLNEVAKEIVLNAVLDNKVYVLVTTPEEKAKSKREEKRLGLRPFIEIITRDKIIDTLLKKDNLDNINRIGVKGSYIKTNGRYVDDIGEEYRIYFDDGIIEIWRDGKLYDTINTEVKKMHILEFSFNDIDIPPFLNEANYQLQHYNIERSKDRYNHKLGFPLVVTWGLLSNDNNIVDGTEEDGTNIIALDNDRGIDFSVNQESGAKLGDLEFRELDGAVDVILKTTLEAKDKAIDYGFTKLTIETKSAKTRDQAKSESSTGESEILQLSQKLEDFLNKIHKLFTEFAGVDDTGGVKTNKDVIDNNLTDLGYKVLSELWQDGIIDDEAYLKELKNYELLQTLDIEALWKRKIATGAR